MAAGQIQRIAFVGATGKLAVPVVEAISKSGYTVRALVRDEAKAKKALPESVELVRADLRQPDTLVQALQGQDAVYINLSTGTARIDLPWYEEREGVRDIVQAAKANGLRHIYKMGSAGTFPGRKQPGDPRLASDVVRLAGNRYIEESGVPYTIFDPTMFMDNIEHQLKGDSWQWLGDPRRGRFYWISSDDYAQQVLAAINRPSASKRHFFMQGPEPLTAQEVHDRFKAVYNPNLKLQSAPLFVVRVLGWFSPNMRYLADMFAYFEGVQETFGAQETWDELGRPAVNIEEYARRLKGKRQSKAASS